jgi:dihydrolipoamide dehydrogenase
MEDHGIRVRTGTKVVKASRSGDEGSVTVTLEGGSSITGDELLVAVGRRPNTEDLGLETIGLEPGSFIEVDDRMRSTQVDDGWLYAIGDANGRALLTHVGKYHARMAADDIAGKEGARIEETAIPRITFTDPQVAAVGLTHVQAKDNGIPVRSASTDLSATAGASVSGVGISGKVQALFDTERDVMVGATFTGRDVSDMLHAATIAIVGEVPVARLRHAVPCFPTVSEVWLHLIESFESADRES